MSKIHPKAIVDPAADIGDGVVVGPYAIIEENTVIGDRTEIGAHTLIASGSRIGSDCRFFHGAAVGTIPQDLKFGGEESILTIGDRTTVREFASLNRGTADRGETTIG
ncbi:MAG: acyl-[acyl-carrier-protein]--UDP-N-acetylglucosamine O-acyltransferase, partial [bacterium]